MYFFLLIVIINIFIYIVFNLNKTNKLILQKILINEELFFSTTIKYIWFGTPIGDNDNKSLFTMLECEIIGDNVQIKELEIKRGDYCIEKKTEPKIILFMIKIKIFWKS